MEEERGEKGIGAVIVSGACICVHCTKEEEERRCYSSFKGKNKKGSAGALEERQKGLFSCLGDDGLLLNDGCPLLD